MNTTLGGDGSRSGYWLTGLPLSRRGKPLLFCMDTCSAEEQFPAHGGRVASKEVLVGCGCCRASRGGSGRGRSGVVREVQGFRRGEIHQRESDRVRQRLSSGRDQHFRKRSVAEDVF